jgi:uncharacterized protein YdeI (YjbR/CyaY-like superfamily)
MRTLHVKDRNRWRTWLRKNPRGVSEIWLLHHRKDSGNPRITYDDAVQEALCFGWIDSTIKKIDEARFAQRFTPRKARSRWSAVNIQRVRKLMAEGRMTAPGLKAFSPGLRGETPSPPTQLRKDLKEQFQMQADAWENFQHFPPFYQRMTIRWVASATKKETQLKRLKQLVEFSARNQRIKFM